MIPLTKTCGKFKIFTKVKIGPLVLFSTGKLASFSESRRVHTKDATCTAGKRGTSVIILLLLVAQLLLELTVPLLFSIRKTSSSYVKEALKLEKNMQVVPGARGGLPARNTLSIVFLEEKKRH